MQKIGDYMYACGQCQQRQHKLKWCLVKQEKCCKKTGADCYFRALKALMVTFSVYYSVGVSLINVEWTSEFVYRWHHFPMYSSFFHPFLLCQISGGSMDASQYKAGLTIGRQVSKENSHSSESGIVVERKFLNNIKNFHSRVHSNVQVFSSPAIRVLLYK